MKDNDNENVENNRVESAFTVTLVHGTFARGAPWASDENAVIRTRLREAFPSRVTVRQFDWSGRNSHAARLEAGAALAEDQAALAASNPEMPRFVIAHSHGGNVALYSLREASERTLPAGIVTMGTPFIACEPRDVAASAPILRLALPALALFAGILGLGMLWVLGFNALRLVSSETTLMIIAGLGALYVPSGSLHFAVLVHRRFPRMAAWAQKRQESIIARLQLPRTSVPTLCIRVAGDEAGAWLRITRTIGDAPYALWRKSTLVLLFLVGVVVNFFAMSEGIADASPTQSLAIAVVLSALLTAGGLLLYSVYWQSLMAVFPKLVRAHGLAFGGESLLDNWLVRIATDCLPPDVTRTVTERAYTVPRSAKGLRHSWMYDQTEIADEIIRWIRLRLHEIDAQSGSARVGARVEHGQI